MKNKIITLPIKAYKEDKIGLLVIPIFAEVLKNKTNFNTTMAINISDCFNGREEYINNYYNLIKDTNIKLDDVWIDSKNSKNLIDEVDHLLKLGFIKEKEKNWILSMQKSRN